MNNEIIEKLAKIIRGEQKMDDYTFNLLVNEGCVGVASNYYQISPKFNLIFSLKLLAKKTQYSVCKRLFSMLQDVKYAVIKGEVLSERIYGDPITRMSCDIDILVASDSVELLKEKLMSEGFIQGRLSNGEIIPFTRRELIYYTAFTHQLGSFIKQTNNPLCPFVIVDVNTNLIWGESEIKIDTNDFLADTESINLYGAKIKRLTPINEFIALCMHHYKDLNSLYLLWMRGITFSHFCDIYYYLVNVAPNSTMLKRSCERLSVLPYVYFCVYHTYEVFQDKRIEQYLASLECPEGRSLLFRIGLSKNEYKYLTKGISSYLFDENFKAMLANILKDVDLKKIEINKRFM